MYLGDQVLEIRNVFCTELKICWDVSQSWGYTVTLPPFHSTVEQTGDLGFSTYYTTFQIFEQNFLLALLLKNTNCKHLSGKYPPQSSQIEQNFFNDYCVMWKRTRTCIQSQKYVIANKYKICSKNFFSGFLTNVQTVLYRNT